MKRKQPAGSTIVASVGYASDKLGGGVAYAAVHDRNAVTVERVAFSVRRHGALSGREAGYAALDAVARKMLAAGFGAVRFEVDDETLATDLSQHRPVPQALTVPYVALRCRLNRFASAEVVHAPSAETTDLGTRALAEASLRVAA